MKWNKGKREFFIVGMMVMQGLFLLYAFLSSGKSITQYIYPDATDSFSDFFSMLKVASVSNIYDMGVSYPPLAMCLFRVFAQFIPDEVLMLETREIKNNVYAIMVYGGYLFICYIILTELIKNKVQNTRILRYIIYVSGPVLYLVQRGNIMFIALDLTLLFCLYYNSDSKWKRELAYIALALAVGIKIYPAIFGLLLLKERRIKDAIHLTMYGIIIFFVPFIFYGGIHNIPRMFMALGTQISIPHGYGYNVSLQNFMDLISYLTHIQLGKWIWILFIILTIILFIVSKEKWKQELLLCLLLIWIPSYSYVYVLSFLIIPLLEFWCKDNENNIYNLLYTGLYVILLSQGALGNYKLADPIGIELWFPMTKYMFIINLSLIAILLLVVIEEYSTYKGNKRLKA